MIRRLHRAVLAGAAATALFSAAPRARPEAMVQYFNTGWREIAERVPELAEAGYSSVWLPPPTKGSGGLSVGYDLWDPFDLGSRNQRGSVTTRYGSEADLLHLVEVAHRFGLRVYFDNIMNHRAFDVPGYDEGTPVDLYPGLVPEDFHLRLTEEGFYRKWDNTRSWGDAWQVMNLGLADLIDLAQEPGDLNFNFGRSEGSTFKKPRFVRQPANPEFYCYRPDGTYAGFGPANGLTAGLIQSNASYYAEYVQDYLHRAARWLVDRTRADGLRLDAVKHVRADFFGATYGADKDSSDYGYLGQVQRQFNLTRGFSDANHRDTVFDTEKARDDAMVFGEHLGEPPGYGDYIAAGMRLVDNPLRNELNNRLGSPWNGLNGYDQPGAGGFNPSHAVMHAQSHDNDYAARRELQHAFYFTRAGLGLLYTDGNHHAETLGESGGAFPRHANTSFLGQWGDGRVPNLLYLHDQFARGDQRGVWSDEDLVAYVRRDYREAASEPDSVTLLMMVNDNYAYGRKIKDKAGWEGAGVGFAAGDYLYNYSTYGGGFHCYGSQLKDQVVPPGGYFAFSFKNPDPSALWGGFGGAPVTILQDGTEVGTVAVVRRDGPDGDPGFNPYGLPDTNASDYAYTIAVPRVTAPSNLAFAVRADGSAENVLLKLDGGVDLNGTRPQGNTDPAYRDHPPAFGTDVFLGYEQPGFVARIHPELFAAVDTASNVTGSAGAETYVATGRLNRASGSKFVDGDTAAFVYHDPAAAVGGTNGISQYEAGERRLWAKTNTGLSGYRVFLYYRDPPAYPEGAGGAGAGGTRTVELSWSHDEGGGAPGSWWRSPALPTNFTTASRYKIGAFKTGAPSWWPGDAAAVTRKRKMMTVFAASNFNAAAVAHFPHNDYQKDPQGNFTMRTGLAEGFHILRARAFLSRTGKASIYHTFAQTFYLDARTPEGEIRFPAADGEAVGGIQYGVVVRTDPTATEVWYSIADGDAANDDAATGVANGNGTGFEPYTDANANGHWDAGEAFADLNTNGTWDATNGTAWARATEVAPTPGLASAYPREWRFNYVNIPASGTATIKVRLREVSSVDRAAFDAHTPASGHFAELVRTVNAAGPDYRLFVAWPRQDGDTVGPGYVMKTWFSKSLVLPGESATQLIDRFLIEVQNSQSGSADGGTPQGRAGYTVNWNIHDDYHELAFTLGNYYNGDADWRHGLKVTLDRPAPAADLVATRLVRAAPVEQAPYVSIVQPAEFGPDGNPLPVILPDVASPSNEQRRAAVQVATASNVVSVAIAFDAVPAAYTSGGMAFVTNRAEGSTLFWDYDWTNLVPGAYRFTASVLTGTGASNSASRSVTVLLREYVDASGTDADDDDDGLPDAGEATATPLPNGRTQDPEPNPENWDNGEVHVHYAYGRSDPRSPDSDGDGLPDGLEVGWRVADTNMTDVAADTNGDGWPNFRPDLDPPFYNTLDNLGRVPGVNTQGEGGDRARQVAGTATDPLNPDTDYDGLPDGVEDANRNGWVDGDGAPIDPAWLPWLGRSWPDGVRQSGETWTETDPNNPDTDGDGALDGYGEDLNANGWIDGDSNSNRVHDAGELWTETDPLNADTDGDGLPDGWERRYGLDALDDGVVGHTSLRTGLAIVTNLNGAAGDPDGDGLTNAQELSNGKDPRQPDTGAPPPADAITVGPGPALPTTVNGVAHYEEFTDWKLDDLLALDEYDGAGPNNQGGDVYHAGDGFDASRDLVAFYARDGGSTTNGGDDRFYFRADVHDLRAYAEEGNLDLYVVIDTGNPSVGEVALPDDVDTGTRMKWEAVVAVYQSNRGRVYVDTNPAQNTTALGEDLWAKGVVARDQAAPDGFVAAHFDSELDAVEFSIARKALTDAGWDGADAASLNFQVFTTRDGTSNTPVGAGDIGGRSDVRDSILDDWIASDYWRDQTYIARNGYLTAWFGRSAYHDAGKSAKVALLLHGNQHLQPGNVIQNLLNDGAGAGYYRPVEVHEAYGAPLNLHVTPTLAAAIQWAQTAASETQTWRLGQTANGPLFNDRLARLAASNVVFLLGSTLSDHALPYFPADFNSNNVALAGGVLGGIYGVAPGSNHVFWTPERVADGGTLAALGALGFRSTLLDQETHLQTWIGRTAALGEDGYRINRIHGADCFILHNQASAYLFANHDGGLPLALRQLLVRRARSGTQDQVVVLFSNWEDLGTASKADAYDRNVRWLANHPWTRLVGLPQILGGQLGTWSVVDRGNAAGARLGHVWINHATRGSYDHWFFGLGGAEESLAAAQFPLRAGTNVPAPWGQVGASGIASQAWAKASVVGAAGLARLARAGIHASVFETAFHDEDNHDTTRFSTGDFLYPDTTYDSLAPFARAAQAQTRHAAALKAVDDWAAYAAGVSNVQAVAQDVDLDGEDEYLLFNDRLFALQERIGGRITGVWVRDPLGGTFHQAAGNFLSYAGGVGEEEGAASVTNGVVAAHRTSLLKDWWATRDGGTGAYVNDLYALAWWTNGWRAVSSDGAVTKTVTLAPRSPALEVRYHLSGAMAGRALYVRHGLSPDLWSLLVRGQRELGALVADGQSARLANTNYVTTVEARVGYGDAGHSAQFVAGATDRPSNLFHTVAMRNQAQTHQVEIVGTNDTFAFALEFRAAPSDWDGDGMPNTYEDGYPGILSATNAADGGTADHDGDRVPNAGEYVARTDPGDPGSFPAANAVSSSPTGIVVRFATAADRVYRVWWTDASLAAPAWTLATTNGLPGTGGWVQWLDDGTLTAPAPAAATQRTYRIEVRLP